jgi:molecular chaperone GrpE
VSIVPDSDQLLERFRAWLAEVDEQSRLAGEPEREPPWWNQRELVEQFTALRHEVKLQTKSARQSQEQADRLLAGLQEAAEQLRATERKLADAAGDVPEAVLETLMNLDDALRRGRAAVDKLVEQIGEELPELVESLEAEFRQLSWWRRWTAGPFCQLALQTCRQQTETYVARCGSLAEGYQLTQARLVKAMRQQQLEGIDSLGQIADPQCMTVVEAVDDPLHSVGLVVEEVRRGYRWRGRVVRFAEVRAVGAGGRPATAGAPAW